MSHSNSPLPSTSSSASYAHSLLRLAHADNTAEATRIYNEKIHHRTFPLRPTEKAVSKPTTTTTTTSAPTSTKKLNARDIRRLSRERKHARRYTSHKPKPLSARERRSKHLHDIPASARKYNIYKPLNTLWKGYMKELLSGHKVANTGTAARISGADFHGAIFEVVRSRCPSRVGIKGIVIKETKMTFFIVTIKDEVKSIPKEHSVFRFQVGGGGEEGERPMVFELHGSNFLHRSSERANKKWKPKPMTDL